MIVREPREPSVAMITRGGAEMGADQATQIEPTVKKQPQVRPTTQKKVPLDVQNKKHKIHGCTPRVHRNRAAIHLRPSEIYS